MKTNIYFLILLLTTAVAAEPTDQEPDLSVGQRWGYGILAGFGLSILGFIAAIILVTVGKRINEQTFKNIVRVLFALACGTLIGDAIIHILSEAFQSQSTNNYFVSLIFICSLLGFMLLEKLMEKIGITHSHWVEQDDHNHSHSQQILDQYAMNPEANESVQTNKLIVQNAKKKQSCWRNWMGKGSAGYLNLLGSFIHNFVDGLSTGLVFATGQLHAIQPMIIAIFSHEIPRQLGDVAILLQSRFTGIQAILSNGIINFMSLVGVVIGLCTIGVSEQVQNYILSFVAANFIYISADIWRNLFKGKTGMNILQFVAFVVGVGSMFGIKFLEDSNGE